MKRHYQTTLALSVLLGIGAHTVRASEFLVTPMTPPTGFNGAIATGINNKGQITGYFSDYEYDGLGKISPLNTRAFVYQNGTATLIPLLPNCTDSTASAINASGQIVGMEVGPGQSHAYLYSGSTVTALSLTTGSQPNAINDNGDIVGFTYDGTNDKAFLYHNGTQTSLSTSDPNTSMLAANGINNDGVVVGYGNPGHLSAFSYKNGVVTNLGNLGTSSFGALFSQAFAVNASGQIAGITSTPTTSDAFLYDAGTMTDLGLLATPLTNFISSNAYALNNSGQVVGGSVYGGQISNDPNHAFLYNNGQIFDLNRLIGSLSSPILSSGTGINDSGQIIVNHEFRTPDGSKFTAYLLTPLTQTVAPAPTIVTAIGTTSSQIQLNWTATVGAGYYKIFRSATANGPMVEIFESNEATFLDTGLQSGATYYYTISSCNSHGVGPKSTVTSGVTLAEPPTDAPLLVGSQYSPYGNRMNWTAVVGATHYLLYRALGDDAFSQVTSTTNSSFIDSGLDPLTRYRYYVVPENAYGTGPQSNIVTAFTEEARPTKRPIVTATAVSSTEIDLTWTTESPTAFYTISRSTAPGGPKTWLAGSVYGNSWHDTLDLKPGTNYFYTVQPATTGGVGPTSIEASATTFGIPSHATSLEAHAVNATEIDLSWARIPGATSYRVLRSLTSGGPHQFIGETTGYSFHNINLPPATKYYYVVSGLNSYGESPKSPEARATTLALPSAPVSLTAQAANCSQINLHWTASSGASSYQIYRSSAPGAAHRYVGTTTALQFADKSLAPNTAFYYVVVALNSHGRSPNSNEAHAKTLALPSTPLNLTASAVSKSRIDLHWTAAFGASSYQIFRATASGASHTYIGTTVNQQFGSTGLAASTSYYYVVVAVNANGSGPKSNEAGAKTLAN